MDFIQITLIIGIITGFVLVILSFPKFGTADMSEFLPREEHTLEKRLEAMGSSISEADSVLTELDDMSQNVMKEMDQKYNEMLFLYNLIDEKKKEIGEISQTLPVTLDKILPEVQAELTSVDHIERPVQPTSVNNPRLSRILELKRSGMSVIEIAKELKMGQSEVALMLSLTKQ